MTTEAKCDAIYTFCKNLIDATLEYVCCYKPNIAFFECVGSEGMAVLHRICTELIVPHHIPILLDVKRGDIGTTASAYAQMCYETLPADAITLSPLMGYDSIVPFLSSEHNYHQKGVFLLCKTSNPGSNDFLNLPMASSPNKNNNSEELLYERIASVTSNTWHPQHPTTTFGLVVGATDTTALQKVRKIITDDVWILAPGIGAQGGNLIDTCTYGMNAMGSGIIIPISRGISTATNPKLAAQTFHQQIQTIRNQRIAEYHRTMEAPAPSLPVSPATDAATVSSSTATATSANMLQLQQYQKDFIQFSIQQQVLQFGTYTLKSGRVSPYFFNAGLFHSGYALYELGVAYATTIMKSSTLTTSAASATSTSPRYVSMYIYIYIYIYIYFGHTIEICSDNMCLEGNDESFIPLGPCY
jgi:uridine monophosphate synthetase